MDRRTNIGRRDRRRAVRLAEGPDAIAESALTDSNALLTSCDARRGLTEASNRGRSLGLDLGKGLSSGLKNRPQAAYSAQPANRNIAVGRIDLNAVAPAPGLFSRDQSCPRADESIEHNALAMRAVPDRIRHHRHRFYGGMQAQVRAVAAKTIDARIVPDVGTVAPVFT